MKEIKLLQDYFSYLRTVFVEKMLTNILNEGNDIENELSRIKQKFNRICSNEACQNCMRPSNLNVMIVNQKW